MRQQLDHGLVVGSDHFYYECTRHDSGADHDIGRADHDRLTINGGQLGQCTPCGQLFLRPRMVGRGRLRMEMVLNVDYGEELDIGVWELVDQGPVPQIGTGCGA